MGGSQGRPPHIEPTRLRRLRWGHYTDRYLAGIALLTTGAVALASGNTYAIFQIALGGAAVVIGWFILPGRVGRRLGMFLPVVVGICALLIGPQGLPLLVLPFLGWMLVRERRGLAYLALFPVAGITVVLSLTLRGFDDMPVALGVAAAGFIACAWLARWLSRIAPTRTSDSPTAQLQNR